MTTGTATIARERKTRTVEVDFCDFQPTTGDCTIYWYTKRGKLRTLRMTAAEVLAATGVDVTVCWGARVDGRMMDVKV